MHGHRVWIHLPIRNFQCQSPQKLTYTHGFRVRCGWVDAPTHPQLSVSAPQRQVPVSDRRWMHLPTTSCVSPTNCRRAGTAGPRWRETRTVRGCTYQQPPMSAPPNADTLARKSCVDAPASTSRVSPPPPKVDAGSKVNALARPPWSGVCDAFSIAYTHKIEAHIDTWDSTPQFQTPSPHKHPGFKRYNHANTGVGLRRILARTFISPAQPLE